MEIQSDLSLDERVAGQDPSADRHVSLVKPGNGVLIRPALVKVIDIPGARRGETAGAAFVGAASGAFAAGATFGVFAAGAASAPTAEDTADADIVLGCQVLASAAAEILAELNASE